ncbi:MAG: hypothetical protein A2Y84_00360 [Candidatus Colwellbacteria bacterium RBG_13_48_8]|uniref:General secretion pathway GspH domain-containing protein n=1 Tax=Candidatus Colwellbacteria bacterium RBG_13_48_8 TaxID=1797685 RepID=A0A1G1YXM4_9BACT|nr:MAG: hypothetical protein A2Y84_00360 [Candidatus Colwellbacteria bacterium RBG_13_48_8]
MLISDFLAWLKRVTPGKGDGFTLFEILIVVGIISILSTVLLGYSQRNGVIIQLASNQAKLQSLLSRAKALSIQTYFEGPGEGENVCAHGVGVEGQEAYIFQLWGDSCPGPEIGSPSDAWMGGYECRGSTELREERLAGELDSINFENKLVEIDEGESNLTCVIFIPPDPVVKINGGEESASVVIRGKDDTGSLGITVTKDGKIELFK